MLAQNAVELKILSAPVERVLVFDQFDETKVFVNFFFQSLEVVISF